jgi:hypothetical protein
MKDKNVTLLVTMPKPYRDLLERMAAERTLLKPGRVLRRAGLARQIICEHLDNLYPKSEKSQSEGQENP